MSLQITEDPVSGRVTYRFPSGETVTVTREELQAFEEAKLRGASVLPPYEYYRTQSSSYIEYVQSKLAELEARKRITLPEKPTIEDVKSALERAESTEQVLSIIEQAKKAGLPAEMAVGYYGDSVGKAVVVVGDVESGKIVEASFMFRGAGERNIFDRAFAEIDIGEHIRKAHEEGFQNIQLAIQKTFMACRPEDALRISLVGVKPPPPPPPPKHVIQVTNQPGVTAATTALEVPPFEEFLKQHPEVQKYPEEVQKQLYNIFLLKAAREKGYSYVMTPSGWAQIPDVNLRVDILSSLKQYTNIPQIAYQVWRATEGKEYERVSLLEAGVRGLTTGFTETVTSIPIVSMFTGSLLRLGALPEPPVGSVPQIAKATAVPSAVEVAPTPEEKQKAMDVLQPPPQLAVYKTMETAGQIAGAIFQQWWPQRAFETWKSIDVQDVLQRYQAGEKLTLLERLKLEAWLHTPEKVWNALAEATSPKVKYEIPKEVEARWARGVGGEGWSGEAWKTEILSWQEVPKDIAEKLRMVSSKAGWLPVKTAKGIEYVPFAQEGVWYDAARGPSWRWFSMPESEWIQYTPMEPLRSGVEWRVWRGLGDYTMFAQYTLGEGLWKGALPKPPIDLGASVEGTVKGVVDINKILEQAELWKLRLSWIEAHPAIEQLKLGGRGMEPLTVVSPMAEVKVPVAPPIETVKHVGLALGMPVISVPVRAVKTSFSLPLPVLPSIPIAPKEKEEGRKEEHPLGPFFPVVVKVKIEPEERLEPEFGIGAPKPRIDFGERRGIERFQPLTIPLRFEKAEKRLEEWLEPLTLAAPAVAEEQARRQAQAAAPIQMMETPQQPSPPSTPSPPAPSSLEWRVRLPRLPYFSPPPASAVYRTPEWRFAKYWRVDWFAEGLKLDFRLGRISRLLAARAKAARVAAGRAERAKLPRRKLETKGEAGERKGRRAEARQVDWFKGGLLGEAGRAKPKKRKRRRKVGAK